MQEGGVVGDHLDVAGRARRDGLDGVVHQRVADARVAEPHRQVGAALACGHHRRVVEVLEADVPQPGQVLAVGHLAVDGDHHARAVLVDHRQRLLPAGRILREQDPDGVGADAHGPVAARNLVDGHTAATAAAGSTPSATAAATAWVALPRLTAPGSASVIGSVSPSGP